jgi:MFS transporter, DHA2 family, multidrug resistance protein
VSDAFLARLRATPALPSVSAFSAAWMVIMATRYYALQVGDINGAIGVGADTGSWLSTAYSVCEPIGVVIGAWLGIALSLRRMLLIAVVMYLGGTCVPLVVPGFGALMVSRVITGLAGGAIMPQCIVIQGRAWGPARAPVAIALYLSATTAAPQLGSLIGAWGVEHFGWTGIFWATFPPGIVSLVTGYVGLRRESIKWFPLMHADVAGIVSLSAALGLFAGALSQGERLRWFQAAAIPILFLTAAICLSIFILREWRSIRHPILWGGLYRRRNITLALLSLAPLQLALSISGVIVPAALAQLHGFRPEQIEPAFWTALWPQTLSYAACVIILLRTACETRTMMILGLTTVALGAFFNLPITSDWQVGELTAGQVIQGIGLPMIALPLMHHFAGDVRAPLESLPGASLFNLSRVLSGTIATAWATSSLRLNSQDKFSDLLANTAFYPDGRGNRLAALTARMARIDPDPLRAHAQAMQVAANAARRQATVLGISETLATLGWLLFASCFLIIVMAEFGRGKAPRPHEKRS